MPRNKLSSFERSARHQIAENLKKYMKGMTQADLSYKTGIPATTLSGYLKEKSTPNAGNLEKMARVLNVEKSDIDPRYHFPLVTEQFAKEKSEDSVQDVAEKKVLNMFRKSTEGMNEDEKLRFQQSLSKLMDVAKDFNQGK